MAYQPRPQLAHHFRINSAGTLVNYHQRNIILPQLPGNCAKDGLRCDFRRQKLVRFLNKDDQRTRFGALAAVRRFLAPHPGFVDAPSQQVADQHIGRRVAAVLAELQHHIVSAFQLFNDAAGGAAALPLLGQKAEPRPRRQPPVQRLQRHQIDANLRRQLARRRRAQIDQRLQPAAPSVMPLQVVGRGRRHFRQVQQLPQRGDVVRLNFVIADADDAVRRRTPALAAFGVQRKSRYPTGEQLLQPFDLPAAVVVLPLPAVFVLHIKDQRHGFAEAHLSGQQHPRQKSLAGAGCAEHAQRPAGQRPQIQSHRGAVHGLRRTQRHCGVGGGVENRIHIRLRCGECRRKVFRDGSCRFGGAAGIAVGPVIVINVGRRRHTGHYRQQPVGRRAAHHCGDERIPGGRRKMPQVVVGYAQFHIGNDAKETLPPALDSYQRPNGHILYRCAVGVAVQPHLDAARQLPGDDDAEPASRTGCDGVIRRHTAISRNMVCRRGVSRDSSAASIRPARTRKPRRSPDAGPARCSSAANARSDATVASASSSW